MAVTVEKVAHWIPVTDEDIVDYGIGAPELQFRAAARIEARQRVSQAKWAALPWWTRVSRTLRWRTYEPRRRLAHAISALRGIDCEGTY